MFYRKFPPRKELLSYVECYYVWEDSEPAKPAVVESPPSAFTAIVFNYGSDYFASWTNGEQKLVPKEFLVGQLTKSYTLHFPGEIGSAAIVFKPTGIAAIFNLSMFAFTNERVDLRAILDEEVVKETASAVNAVLAASEKVAVLESFVMQYFIENSPTPDQIDEAANKIVSLQGRVNIHELCDELFITRRQFERKFLQRVGLSPKYYARMRRISAICREMAGKENVNWQDLYYELDYYDQSHFIKDFTEFTGRSPREYFHSNAELIHRLKNHPAD